MRNPLATASHSPASGYLEHRFATSPSIVPPTRWWLSNPACTSRRTIHTRWASFGETFQILKRKEPPPHSEKKRCRPPVSRILSTPVLPGAGRSFLSIPLARNAPLARSATNTREFNGRAALSLLCLAPPGVCTAAPVTLGAVGSYPTISPLPSFAEASAGKPPDAPVPAGGIFLLHFPSGFLSVPVPCFHRASCPTVSGLSSTRSLRPHCDRPGDGSGVNAEMLKN